MKLILISILFVVFLVFPESMVLAQEETAGPAEVIAKVHKAAAMLAEKGPEGLEVLRDNTSEFTWKDTYVFVFNCESDEVLANPAFPQRQGGKIKQEYDANGKHYGLEFCMTAMQSEGGWVEYVWPRPGEYQPIRKISYVMSVEGLPYQLGAGIYNGSVTLDELNELIKITGR